jgi:hypothetical protein
VRVPAPDLLAHILQDYVQTCGGWASVVWQGGEPLLAGLPFFQRVVALQAQYAPRGTVLSNAVQTNGVLLNDAWAQFFATYRFFVGVSLDGPAPLHDARRVDAAGRGTFRRVRRGLEHLRARGVAFNVLTVVGPHNVDRGAELVAFYRGEGLRWVQFLPEMAFYAQRPADPGRYAITPKQYGDFLCTVFDAWYQEGEPDLHIRFFDDVLQDYLTQTPEICTMQAQCPPRLVVEVNGDPVPLRLLPGSDLEAGQRPPYAAPGSVAVARVRAFSRAQTGRAEDVPHVSVVDGVPRRLSPQPGRHGDGGGGTGLLLRRVSAVFCLCRRPPPTLGGPPPPTGAEAPPGTFVTVGAGGKRGGNHDGCIERFDGQSERVDPDAAGDNAGRLWV